MRGMPKEAGGAVRRRCLPPEPGDEKLAERATEEVKRWMKAKGMPTDFRIEHALCDAACAIVNTNKALNLLYFGGEPEKAIRLALGELR